MKAFTALVAVALSISGALAQDTFTVNTPPSAVVCQPLLITWVGGTPPYFLSILPGGQPGAAALVDFGQIPEGTSHRWPAVNIPAGTSIGINLRDSTGTLVQSAAFPVNAGSDTACLTAPPTSSSSTTSTRSTTTSGSSSSTTSTTTSSSTTTTTTTTTSSTTTTTPRTSSSTTNTAPPASSNTDTNDNSDNGANRLQVGFAGAIAGAAALLLL